MQLCSCVFDCCATCLPAPFLIATKLHKYAEPHEQQMAPHAVDLRLTLGNQCLIVSPVGNQAWHVLLLVACCCPCLQATIVALVRGQHVMLARGLLQAFCGVACMLHDFWLQGRPMKGCKVALCVGQRCDLHDHPYKVEMKQRFTPSTCIGCQPSRQCCKDWDPSCAWRDESVAEVCVMSSFDQCRSKASCCS